MKPYLRILLPIVLAAVVFSCSDDSDDPNSPNNPNNPNNPDNPCYGVVCENGGTCVNGACDCPNGYGGPDCGTPVNPSSVRITRIDVLSFPPTDGGAGWDLTSGADIYVKYFVGNSFAFSTGYIQNASPNVPNQLTVNPVFTTSSYGSHRIELFDFDDFDPDDYMGGHTFNIAEAFHGMGFPAYFTVGTGSLVFGVHLSYQF